MLALFCRRDFCCSLVKAGFLLVFWLTASVAHGQHTLSKHQRKHYKERYRQQARYYDQSCKILERKKENPSPVRHRSASSWMVNRAPQAEMEYVAQRPQPQPQPAPAQQPVAQPEPVPSEQELAALHQKEIEVLNENHIPAPQSDKQEEIRKRVAEQIKSHQGEHIELAPLFFNFNEDEFSVVDMDPFLIAVEFALQGKHILIEGHTDPRGSDQYNVQLSIKRVKKIQQLMHQMGVPDDRISIIGYGEEHTVNSQDEKEHQESRRVDFKAF